jgi:hypothetical protein
MGMMSRTGCAPSANSCDSADSDVTERIDTVDSSLERVVARGVAAALGWWGLLLEQLTESEHDGLRRSDKTYVGLHTPDTDPVSIRMSEH